MTGMIGYRFEGFTFLPEVNALRFPAGKATNLAAVFSDLLLVFVKNPGCDLSFKDLIIQSGSQINLSKDTLAHRVIELRKLIEVDPHHPTIITKIQGFGYRFSAEVEVVELVDKDRLSVVFESQYADIHRENRNVKRRNRDLEVENRVLRTHNAIFMLASLEEPDRAFRVFEMVRYSSKRLTGPEQQIQISTLESIDDFIQDAFSYYQRTLPSRELELAGYLSHSWLIQGRWSQGCAILRGALSRCPEVTSDAGALALAWLAFLSYCRDDYEFANRTALQSKRICEQIGNDEALALALYTLASVAGAKQNYAEERSRCLECLKVSQRSNIRWLTAWALLSLGAGLRNQGHYISAGQRYEASLKESENIHDARGIAVIQTSLSIISCVLGDIEQAKVWADKSMDCQASEIAGRYYSNIGMIEEYAGQHKASFDYFKKSLSIRRDIGDRRGQARSIEGMAKAAYLMGNEREAAGLYGTTDKIRKIISAPMSLDELKSHGQLRLSLQKKYFKEYERGSERVSETLKS